MANKSTKTTKTQTEVASALKGVRGPAKAPLTKMVQDGLKVQVVGRVKNGKVVLDQSTLEEIARKFPNAEMAFVAVNAPFDPVRHQEEPFM